MKAASGEVTRVARIAASRERRNNNKNNHRARPHTSPEGRHQGYAPPLRRYSDLNLGLLQQQQSSTTPAASSSSSGMMTMPKKTAASNSAHHQAAAQRPHTTGGGGRGGGYRRAANTITRVIPNKTRCAAPDCDGRTRMVPSPTSMGRGAVGGKKKSSSVSSSSGGGDDWPLSKPRPVPAFLV